jgi:hypothetical protein
MTQNGLLVVTLGLCMMGCPKGPTPKPGASLTLLPDGVWVTGDLPCPYDEIGPLKVQAWAGPMDTVFTEIAAPPQKGDWRQISLEGSEGSNWKARSTHWNWWRYVNSDLENRIEVALSASGADALILPVIYSIGVEVTRAECEELSSIGCDWNYHRYMMMMVVEGLAVNWLCPEGYEKPKRE